MANLVGKSAAFVAAAKKRADEERIKKDQEDKEQRSSHAHYGEPLYWDQRYEFEDKRQMEAGTKLFDWCLRSFNFPDMNTNKKFDTHTPSLSLTHTHTYIHKHTHTHAHTSNRYAPFDKIYPIVESVVDTTRRHKVLLLGIGKSDMIEVLVAKGFRGVQKLSVYVYNHLFIYTYVLHTYWQAEIVATDVSSFIVSKMQNKYASYGGIEFLCLDAR